MWKDAITDRAPHDTLARPDRFRIEPLEARVFLAGNGLMGQYYDDANLTTLKFTRTDPTINFDFANRGPLSAVAPDTFSARWTGQILAPATGTYTFRTLADDGVRLWVRGQLLIDRWSDRPRYPGDANNDLQVDVTDLGVLATNWQQSPRAVYQGDFNGDRIVDVSDLGILASNWQSPPP